MILHRNKRREFIVDCIVLHCVELVSVATRHPNVPRISSLDDIVQSLHRLGNRGIVVESMALEDIDIVELEALKRVFDRIKNMLEPQK